MKSCAVLVIRVKDVYFYVFYALSFIKKYLSSDESNLKLRVVR